MTSPEAPDPALAAAAADGVPGVARLVGLDQLPTDEWAAVEIVAALVDRAFAAGNHRVEAEVPSAEPALQRVLRRVGLRPEGMARGRATGPDGIPVDVVRMARLRDDPEPGEPGAFLGMLNATLPRKRVIVQGVADDGAGRFLLCELTYKAHWDLPGGVAEPAESPVTSLRRELREELGLDLPVGELIAVDWLPPYKQWEDAVLLVFDLGSVPDLIERAVLQPTELRAVHWTRPEQAGDHVAPYVARLLDALADRSPGRCLFLEDGLPRCG
ncbi:NUDIX hydrolase [Ornithinimicrobium sufpigmenti]|uniref:NUDIX hydrolase n=1 Tax=Ornithinimicrobium sufpigmenti TaxID=2508882 RepID=UPI001EDD3A0E|nr:MULTISPECIES: NUDIX hydrolase [unclassified Ornithinimicrobium]